MRGRARACIRRTVLQQVVWAELLTIWSPEMLRRAPPATAHGGARGHDDSKHLDEGKGVHPDRMLTTNAKKGSGKVGESVRRRSRPRRLRPEARNTGRGDGFRSSRLDLFHGEEEED